jgi:hypothetical protein
MNAEQRKSIKALCQRHMVHTDRSEFAKQAVPEIAKTLSELGIKSEANTSAIKSIPNIPAMHGMPADIMFVEINGESVPLSFSDAVTFIENQPTAVGFVSEFERISASLIQLYEGHQRELKGANGVIFDGDIFHSEIYQAIKSESFKGDGITLIYSIACSYLRKKNFKIWS